MFRAFRELSKSNNNFFHGIAFHLRGTSSYSDLIFLDRRKVENEWKKAENEWKRSENEWNNDDNHEQQRIFDYEGGARINTKK